MAPLRTTTIGHLFTPVRGCPTCLPDCVIPNDWQPSSPAGPYRALCGSIRKQGSTGSGCFPALGLARAWPMTWVSERRFRCWLCFWRSGKTKRRKNLLYWSCPPLSWPTGRLKSRHLRHHLKYAFCIPPNRIKRIWMRLPLILIMGFPKQMPFLQPTEWYYGGSGCRMCSGAWSSLMKRKRSRIQPHARPRQ